MKKYNLQTWTRCDRFTSKPIVPVAEGKWVIEPGDMTHYELEVTPRFAVFRVGTSFDAGCRLVVLTVDGDYVDAYPFDGAREDYEVAIATFVLRLVLGQTTPEPECLACRRGDA